jgi:hypothetical protein
MAKELSLDFLAVPSANCLAGLFLVCLCPLVKEMTEIEVVQAYDARQSAKPLETSLVHLKAVANLIDYGICLACEISYYFALIPWDHCCVKIMGFLAEQCCTFGPYDSDIMARSDKGTRHKTGHAADR